MEFKRYSDIENSYRQKFLDEIMSRAMSGGLWIVEEKIHGANFSLLFDGTTYSCAKRTQIIGEGDGQFFNHKLIMETYKDAITKLWGEISAKDGACLIQVYGELFGGNYPHPDVERVQNAKGVQGQVYYSPANQFITFDLRVNGIYRPVEDAKALMASAGFLTAETLLKGTLEEALAYPNLFPTTIPTRFGLPAIEDNICEGVVIKPVEVKYMGDTRVVLKNKNAKFSEKEDKVREPRPEFVFSEEGQVSMDGLSDLVTENRLRNVLSKIGEITEKDFGKVMGEMSKDVMKDFLKDNEVAYEEVDKEERKRIQRVVQKDIADMIRKNFLNIVDGVF